MRLFDMSMLAAAGLLAVGLGFAGFGGRADHGLGIAQSAAAKGMLAAPTGAEQTGARVVAELFTSQGCSSCPPADIVAARLVDDPSVMVISRPVTYWDRLGWKDTLAREDNTALQRAYAAQVSDGVYTPQMVINGRASAIGSREGDVRALIEAGLADTLAHGVAVAVDTGPNGVSHVTIRARQAGAKQVKASVMLVALSRRETVAVGRGENGGRRLSYTNVLRDERTIGSFDGSALTLAVRPLDRNIAGADRYAVIVRTGPAGRILGAAYL